MVATRINAYPTGRVAAWGTVERQLEDAKSRLQAAKSGVDFAAVGESCSYALLMLFANSLLNDRPSFPQGKSFLSSSVVGVLTDVLSEKLSGPTRDAAKANLALAANLIDTGIHTLDQAEVCLTATNTLIRLLGISSGLRSSRETVANLCEKFLTESKDLGQSHVYAVQRFLRMPIGKKIAAELTPQDVIDHCQERHAAGTSPATITQDVVYLRGVVAKAHREWAMSVSTDPIDHAKPELVKLGLIGRSKNRDRRPTRAEIQQLLDMFVRASRLPQTKIPMHEIMEFALWSARRIGEICLLRWEDLDEKNRTCRVNITDSDGKQRQINFPLLGRAWDVVARQPRTSDRIFPYKRESAIQRYVDAKKRLGIEDLRFADLRREAAIRLYESGYSVEEISKVTGRLDLNTLLRDVQSDSRATPASSSAEAH